MGITNKDILKTVLKVPQIESQLEHIEVQKADKTALDVESKRIDAFTSLGQGSTTGDAELIDGRIGADGIKYNNIGGAIRTQVSTLTNIDSEIIGYNPYYELNWIQGEICNSAGVISSSNSWKRTDYTLIKNNTKLLQMLITRTSANSYNCFFDKNKKFISSFISSNGVSSIVIPSEAEYFILSAYPSDKISIKSDINGIKYIENLVTNNNLNTNDFKMLNGRGKALEIQGVSNRYSDILDAPNDLKGLLGISKICGFYSMSTNSKYLAYPTASSITKSIIATKYIYFSFCIRTMATIVNVEGQKAIPIKTNGTVTSWVEPYKNISFKIKDSNILADTKEVLIKYELKDEYIGQNINFYDLVNIEFGTLNTSDKYNGFQNFYFRMETSNYDNKGFDFSYTLETNKKELTNGFSHGIYKKICLYGTSIEEANYFKSVAENLGLVEGVSYLNYGAGGGTVTWYGKDIIDFTPESSFRLHLYRGFSCTLAEKIAEIERRGIDISTIPQKDLNISHDISVMGNLDADLYIFGTYGVNDRQAYITDGFIVNDGANEYDRRTIYGAYNFVIKKLLEAKPDAKIIILGQHLFTGAKMKDVNEVQRKVSEKWCIPFLDWGTKLGINSITQELFTTDGLHLSKRGYDRAGSFLFNYLKNNKID